MKKHSIDTFNTPRFMLISEKNQIDLLQRLHDLLQHGFTLSESFKFLLQHIKIKSPKLISLINTRLDQGAQCYEILSLLKYPKIIIMLIYFSELFSELTSTLPHAKDYLIRNNKAKQQLIRTLQYPLLLITIFIGMLPAPAGGEGRRLPSSAGERCTAGGHRTGRPAETPIGDLGLNP